MDAILSGLTGASSILGGLFNTFVGDSLDRSKMAYQARLNQAMIDRMNVYNSPIESMKRIREAGLNPNLVYGRGVEGNQSSASSVGLSGKNVDLGMDLSGAVQDFFTSQQIDNQTKQTKANAALANANEVLSRTKALREMKEIARLDATFDTYVEKMKADLDYTRQAYNESVAREGKTYEEWNNLLLSRDKLMAEVELMKEKVNTEHLNNTQYIPAKIRNLESSTELNAQEKLVARTVASLNEKKLEEIDARIRNLNSSSDLNELAYKLQKDMADFGVGNVSMKDIFSWLIKLITTIAK